jgi:hypothetical protein
MDAEVDRVDVLKAVGVAPGLFSPIQPSSQSHSALVAVTRNPMTETITKSTLERSRDSTAVMPEFLGRSNEDH